MQTDNTTAVQTAIDLACLFANPLLNSGQQRLGQLAVDVSLAVFSRLVLTDDADNTLKIAALKSYLSNSNGLKSYQHEFYNFLETNDYDNLKTLLTENKVKWRGMEKNIPLIAKNWSQSLGGSSVGVVFTEELTHGHFSQKQALYTLLKNPPEDFYETFFYGKALRSVETSNKLVESAQLMNQQLLKDIAAQNFLSVADVQAKIQERRNEVKALGGQRNIPPGVE